VLEKGLDVVAATMAELTRRGIAHRLLVVGDGPAHTRFAAQVPQAVFVGFLGGDALPRAYASADMLINPSTTETFGNVTLEAMASGLPVVAARATGNDCLVENGVTGALIQPGNAVAFADAIAALIADPVARAAAGAAGVAAAQDYDWDTINGTVLDHYRAVVANFGRQTMLALPG
jgi:phosphatidylinositol alpha 1,6-mannosyltransferase